MGSPRDQRHYEPPSAEELEAEFPGWQVFKGVEGTGWWARRPRTSPVVVLGHAADLGELRERMIAWKRQQEARP